MIIKTPTLAQPHELRDKKFRIGAGLVYNADMNERLKQAISAATANLSEEGQSNLARFIIDEAKRLSILEAVAKADANPNAGVPHEEVCKWLESWGTENELPPPTCKPS